MLRLVMNMNYTKIRSYRAGLDAKGEPMAPGQIKFPKTASGQ